MAALPQGHFNSVIRVVKRWPADRVQSLQTAVRAKLDALGVKPNGRKVVRGMPDGSDQAMLMDLLLWVDTIVANDTEATTQLVAIDATAVARLSL